MPRAPFVHGTYRFYAKGCRCTPCIAAMRAYHARRNAVVIDRTKVRILPKVRRALGLVGSGYISKPQRL